MIVHPPQPTSPARSSPPRVDVAGTLGAIERLAFVARRELESGDGATARAKCVVIRELAAKLPSA